MGGPLQGSARGSCRGLRTQALTPGQRFPASQGRAGSARRSSDAKGYEGEILGNLKAALDVRLGSLSGEASGSVRCDEGIPSAPELFEQNVVLEMDYLFTPRTTLGLMTLFVLTALPEHIRA